MTHTPGPWHEPTPYPPAPNGALRFEVQGGHRKLAIVSDEIDDAYLIAAAPELLAALEAINHAGTLNDQAVIDQMRAAIAKAKHS